MNEHVEEYDLLDIAYEAEDGTEFIGKPLFPTISDEALVVAVGPFKGTSRQVQYEYYGLRLMSHYLWTQNGQANCGIDNEASPCAPATGTNGSGSNAYPAFMLADTLGMPVGVYSDGSLQSSDKHWAVPTPIGTLRRIGFRIDKGYADDNHGWALVRVRGELGLALATSNGTMLVGIVNKGMQNTFNGLYSSLSINTPKPKVVKEILHKSVISFSIDSNDTHPVSNLVVDNREQKEKE